ncbi:MAG: hypothetical protein JST10_03460 [Bacteroidetes bacterium]|nr:hypothetical protein [Bacteroidota bacterium]
MNIFKKGSLYIGLMIAGFSSLARICDTSNNYYYCYIGILPLHGRPLGGNAILRNVPVCLKTDNSTDFICDFYSNSVFVNYPILSHSLGYKYLEKDESSEDKLDKLDEEFERKFLSLRKATVRDSFYLADSTKVYITISRFGGSFWIEKNEGFLNNTTNQFYIDPECYQKDFYYLFKNIGKVKRMKSIYDVISLKKGK